MNEYFHPRTATADLTQLFGQAAVISFDVFDTLLLRKLHRPVDLFELLERQAGVPGFAKARRAAERKARAAQYRASGSREVTLWEIYQRLQPAQRELLPMELQAERDNLVRSPFIAGIYNLARATGKPIIAISDMYLPADFIADLLRSQAMPVDRVFVSCEQRCAKASGELFRRAAACCAVAPAELLHFGDHFTSDYLAALQAGAIGYHLPAPRAQLLQDGNNNGAALARLAGCVEEGNLFASLLLAWLSLFRSRTPQPSAAALFGAMYAGPMVAGGAIWLRLMMQLDGIAHMRLAARDGYIIKRVWDALGFTEPASVLQISRRLTMVPALARHFESEMPALLGSGGALTLRQRVARLGLADAAALLEALGRLTPLDRPLDTPASIERARRGLACCKTKLVEIAEAELAGYQSYLQGEGFDPAHDALADCGWALSSQRRLELALERPLRGYYIGSLAHAHMHAGIKSFLFHAGDEKAWVAIAEAAVELLELPFAATEPQIYRFERTGTGARPIRAHAGNYQAVRAVFIEAMQAEIVNFAEFLAPYAALVTVEEMREALFCLFDSLVRSPTPFEYHQLAALPHDREFGQSAFATIGTFWRSGAARAPRRGRAAAPRLRDYLRVGLLTWRQAGLRVTLRHAVRVLRRRLRAHA